MGFFKETWEGFSNYLHSTKEEVKNEWDEFQEEVDKTSAYEQSTASDILQQTSNGISFAVESVGSLINNKSTRALASETIEDITHSEIYNNVTESIEEGVSKVNDEVNRYLDAHPETKEQLQKVSHAIDEKVDEGIDYVKEVATEHDEALRNIGAVGAVAAAVIPVAKGAKLLAKAERTLPNEFRLSPEKNKEVFDTKVLPKLIADEKDFSEKENPKMFFTGGLPGAGKSHIVDEIKAKEGLTNIIISDADAFRKHHPDIKEIQEKFGHLSGAITNPDAGKWALKTINEALKDKADVIKDSTLQNAKELKTLVNKADKKGYDVDITIKAVNEYEALEGTLSRYAQKYEYKPHEARYVPPHVVKQSKEKIEETAESIKNLDNVDSFKIVNREGDVIYDKSIHLDSSPKEMMQEATHLKNYPKEKIEALEKSLDDTIDKLKEVNAPKDVQQSAKNIRHELATELHPIKARVMTKETGVVVGGVATYVGADKLHESVQSSNTLEENTIDLTQYLSQSVQNKNLIDDSTYENSLPPSIDSYLDQFKSENNQTQYDTREEDYSKEDDLDTYLPQSVQRTDTITPSYHEDTIEETFNDDDNTTLEAQRIYNDMAERNGWNNDYGNDYDRGMEID